MKRKSIILVAIVSAFMLASCNGNDGKTSESAAEPTTQESSISSAHQSDVEQEEQSDREEQESGVDEQESNATAQENAETTSANEPAEASTETPVSVEKKYPSEKQLPGKPFKEPAPDPTPIPNDTGLHGYNKIELSGNRDDHVITDKLCYLRSDKYVMFFEPDLDLPGDLKKNLDLVVDTIEDVVGLPFNAPNFQGIPNTFANFESNPWEGIELNGRIYIYVLVDREDKGLISGGHAEGAEICINELFTEELWNSVPSYRDNAWRRSNFIDYYTFAHELTHVLTGRYATMTSIMTEGCADYVAESVMERLKDTSADFKKSYEYMKENFSYQTREALTKDNAEDIFIDDFSDLTHAERGSEYALGRMICKYLSESYGEAFLRDYMDAVKDLAERFDYKNMSQNQREKYAKKFKYLFGDDAFVNFAEWYEKNAK